MKCSRAQGARSSPPCPPSHVSPSALPAACAQPCPESLPAPPGQDLFVSPVMASPCPAWVRVCPRSLLRAVSSFIWFALFVCLVALGIKPGASTLSYICNYFFIFYFLRQGFAKLLSCPGGAQTCDSPASVSQSAKITVMGRGHFASTSTRLSGSAPSPWAQKRCLVCSVTRYNYEAPSQTHRSGRRDAEWKLMEGLLDWLL